MRQNSNENKLTNKVLIDTLKTSLKKSKFYIKTYGCQMNVNDSSSVKALFESIGLSETMDIDTADIILINTCCVREKAESKVYSYIGRLKKLKKTNKNLIIIISGCMSEQKDVKKDIFARFPHVDIVVGTGMVDQLPQYILKKIKTTKRVNFTIDSIIKSSIPIRKASRISEFITIMTGCDNYCSYCIVPYVRGRESSRNHIEILDEIKNMTKQGCKEVTLLGQNVNSYGLDNHEINFTQLLQMVSSQTDICRIRFMTSHPKDITFELLDVMSNDNKICNHIHLPFQSGSDIMLDKMNRKYNRSHYLEIMNYAKKIMPDIEFTTDIIVGFPGETEKDFTDTLDMLDNVRFASAYMFKYSIRTGTPAAEYTNQIDAKIKSGRLDRLMKHESKIKKEIYTSYINRTVEILVESKSPTGDTYTGRCDSGITVNFEGHDSDIGKLVNIKITIAKTNTLFGNIIGEQ